MSKTDYAVSTTRVVTFPVPPTTAGLARELKGRLESFGMAPGWVDLVAPGLAAVIDFSKTGGGTGTVVTADLGVVWRYDADGDLVATLSFTTTEH